VLQSSANLAGGRDPRTLDEVAAAIRAGVDFELDRGELPGTPSTVVDLRDYEQHDAWRVVRTGALTEAQVRRALVGSLR
jgi:L-threonylcarbamoyladenylate synthase